MQTHGFGGKDRGVLMNRVPVQPALLRWAGERSGRNAADLQKRFSRLEAWEQGSTLPTLKQLEAYARATRTPIGYFFLQEPPVESLPVTDFRTVGNADVRRPSPDLLDMLYLCQQRQDWYRDEARTSGEQPLAFVGSLDTSEDTITGAARLRDTLGFDIEQQRKAPTWDQALRQFIRHADASGVLVMVSGVVGSNTHRLLDPKEFRGFALADPFAPLVFINGKDAKAAQIFTLAHEIAHLWLGESGVSNPQADFVEDADFVADAESTPHHSSERWCNNRCSGTAGASQFAPQGVQRRHPVAHRSQSTRAALQGQRSGRPSPNQGRGRPKPRCLLAGIQASRETGSGESTQ